MEKRLQYIFIMGRSVGPSLNGGAGEQEQYIFCVCVRMYFEWNELKFIRHACSMEGPGGQDHVCILHCLEPETHVHIMFL